MLTKRAKIECRYMLKKIEELLKQGNITQDQREMLLKKREGLKLIIKEMSRLEETCVDR